MAFSRLQKKGEGITGTTQKKMKNTGVDPNDLQYELEWYSQRGVALGLEGIPSSPSEIVHAHLIAEECGYMRDYVQDEKGGIRKIDFSKVYTY